MTSDILISAERDAVAGAFTARITVKVVGPGEASPPAWAAEKAISHVDSVVDAMAHSLQTVLDLVRRPKGGEADNED